ncbi:MAG: anti-sigma factor [Dehalococcoidia bacterium]
MNHDEVQELLADFALGLVDEPEAGLVRQHLEECAICRDDLQLFLEAGEALALSPDDIPLPPGARERIASGVAARIGPRPQPAQVSRQIIIGPWRNIALGTAAAVLLLAIGLTSVTIAWLNARDDVDRLEGQLAARAIELPLSGDGAEGTIYVAADFGSGVARFSGLPVAPAEHHYQIWSEGPDGAKSAADFTGSDGELLVQLPALPKEMTRMFVTIEPDGAAGQAPTGPEVMTTPH